MNEHVATSLNPGWMPSLGSYLQTLGLLSALAQMHPTMEARWQGGKLLYRHDSHEYRDFLANQWQPKYRMWWGNKIGNATILTSLRTACTEEEAEILDAHGVASEERILMNPVLALMGRSRNSTFEKARRQALEAIEKADQPARKAWICCALDDTVAEVPDIMMSHWWWPGAQRISPYSMLLALDGAVFLYGAAINSSAGYPFFLGGPSGVYTAQETLLSKGNRYRYVVAVPTWREPMTASTVREWFRIWPKQTTMFESMAAAHERRLPPETDALYYFGLTTSFGHLDRWCVMPNG